MTALSRILASTNVPIAANDNFHLRLVSSNGRASETLGSLRKAYSYDQTGAGYGFGIGHLTSLTDAAGSLTRSYDERGNMLTSKRTNGANVYTTTYGFDPASRIASVTYPSGSLVTNVYDTAGYLHLVKAKPTGSPVTTTLATLTHLPFGPINSNSYGNGIAESWTFDEDYRSTNITDTHSATTLQNLTYGYDADNNVKTIADAVNAANGQTLGYDVLNRINSAVSGTGGYGSLSWTYDKNGNVKTFKVGSSTTSYTYTSGTNRLAAITGPTIPKTVSTNANGNITSIPPANSGTNATFSYGNDNRLASVTGSPVAASFVYDAFGQRFSKTDSGGTPITYAYGPTQRLIEENNNGAISDYVYADGRPISVLKVGSGPTPVTSYILADRLGTPQLATNGSAATVWATTYQPYGTTGAITGTLTQNLRLPGQNWDFETGFYYNIHRDYMPNIGRYLETDPIGLQGGFNSYAYVADSPYDASDPLGLRALTACEKLRLSPYIPQVDLDNADVHENGTPWWVRSDAEGFTSGDDIYFKPGAYDPLSPGGLALLGHELVHVGQYRLGMTYLDYAAEAILNGAGMRNKYENPAYTLQNKINSDLAAQYGTGDTCGCGVLQ